MTTLIDLATLSKNPGLTLAPWWCVVTEIESEQEQQEMESEHPLKKSVFCNFSENLDYFSFFFFIMIGHYMYQTIRRL